MAVDAGHTSHAGGGHQSQAVTHLHRDINRRIVDANSVVRVLDIVEDASQDFNAVNISTAFHRVARMWRDLPDLSASSSGGQGRLDDALQTLMQLAVSHIKEVICDPTQSHAPYPKPSAVYFMCRQANPLLVTKTSFACYDLNWGNSLTAPGQLTLRWGTSLTTLGNLTHRAGAPHSLHWGISLPAAIDHLTWA